VKFLVNEGSRGDELLDLLARHPKTPARPARPYGVNGWLLEGWATRSRATRC
jgi:hypothetical protein